MNWLHIKLKDKINVYIVALTKNYIFNNIEANSKDNNKFATC